MLPFRSSQKIWTVGMEDLDTVETEELVPVETESPYVEAEPEEIVPESDTPVREDTLLQKYLTEEYYNNIDEFKSLDTNAYLQNTTETFIKRIKIAKCPVYTYYDKKNERTIGIAYITDIIVSLDYYTELILLLHRLEEQDLLYLFIDSPGGDLSTGATIASHIERCRGKVIGVARGFCASAASLIWSSCQVPVADICSVFLYHMSSHFDFGNSEDIRIHASLMVEYVKKNLLQVALDRGHITEEEYITICDRRQDVIIPGYVMNERLTARRSKEEEGTL